MFAPTAGEDSPIRFPVTYFHRTLPDARSNAMRSPFPPPTYTVPSATAADDSMMSPSWYDQSTLSATGGVAFETPVRVGVPRNCRHSSAGEAGTFGGCEAAEAPRR